MDNPLTPKKIQRLIQMAEDRSSNVDWRLLLSEEDLKMLRAQAATTTNTNRYDSVKYESSSGILDLDRVEGFGESGSMANMSLSKSTTFNPGELTGRSTGTESTNTKSNMALGVPRLEEYGRHSLGIESLTSQMDKQTNEINDIMRHSIASNYTFHSKPNLTADEASLIVREAPIPLQTVHTQFLESSSVNNSTPYNVSVGSYFKNRCPEFGKMLAKTDSPNKSSFMMPSITEVSCSTQYDHKQPNPLTFVDSTLDCVPVRQPRASKKQSELPVFKKPCKPIDKLEISSIVPEKSQTKSKTAAFPQKTYSSASKPADLLLKNLQQSSLRLLSEDTEGSENNSFSVSKIADYLDRQSNVSVTEMMHFKKPKTKKQPLSELQMNAPRIDEEVTNLIDTKKAETASSAGTINTVVPFENLNIKDIPEVVVTRETFQVQNTDTGNRVTRSKSPSTKSQSTLSTVRDNYSSFKSGDSPNSSKGLEQWANIAAPPVEGFVGVSCPVTITVTTLVDSWLTAKLQIDELLDDKDINIDLPRLPRLLEPGKSDQFTFSITSNVEINTRLQYTIHLKDPSIDGDIEQKGEIEVNFKVPVIQAMSADGLNKVAYAPIPEMSSCMKSFIIISDCPADLQLKLCIVEGESLFCIKNVQEIKKSDVNKLLLQRQPSDDQNTGKSKNKATNMQFCRLTQGNAIRVTVSFVSPKLAQLQISSKTKVTFNGALNVYLLSGDAVIRKIDLVGIVGMPVLGLNISGNKLHLSNEPVKITVKNTGTISGSWSIIRGPDESDDFPFQVSPTKFELQPGASTAICMAYTGLEDDLKETTIVFEEITTGNKTTLDISGGLSKPKQFPIKSNYSILSWVRPGRKEISLKNVSDKKIYIRCHLLGEGFSIDLPKAESRGIFVVPFEAKECRYLPIVFTPYSLMPCTAVLHLVFDKNSDTSRKVKLFGCNSGEVVRWPGLVTYSDTAAQVRAVSGMPVELQLYNKSPMPAFVAARMQFNVHYRPVETTSALKGANRIIAGRSRHTISLQLDWRRVERRAYECGITALATITVLTGAEFTRRRILRILRNESNGELDTSLLPARLNILADQFEEEDSNTDTFFKDFEETEVSLNELVGGLQELTVSIDLPQDFGESTIVVLDDTMINHHTLIE
ncbi:uncharacterized protein LOC113231352 isoform X2 [Hyposmocoma kahamanoa]|uniref:uncharacterized protein LOC113231352 isoform X2 n=1 Tax=Hyposmocoma kahamanoa TaxID=1477025 RepID=UPI000E6D5E8A|nr:uncharacterized protein LOC113231352 isoform X2 [Hyposmocoma kahamanoa]